MLYSQGTCWVLLRGMYAAAAGLSLQTAARAGLIAPALLYYCYCCSIPTTPFFNTQELMFARNPAHACVRASVREVLDRFEFQIFGSRNFCLVSYWCGFRLPVFACLVGSPSTPPPTIRYYMYYCCKTPTPARTDNNRTQKYNMQHFANTVCVIMVRR